MKRLFKILANFSFGIILIILLSLIIAISEKILNVNLERVFFLSLLSVCFWFIFEHLIDEER